MADRNSHVEITVPVNYCSSLPCQNGGQCLNSGSTYICRCPSNFSGPRCQHYDRMSRVNWVSTTTQPRVTTTSKSLNAPGTAALGSLLALVVLTLIFVICCLWRSKTRRVPLSTSGRPADGSTTPRLSSFNSLSERVAYNLHRNTHVASRVGGGSVNHGYDPAIDLPPPYLSVVAEPKFIIDVDNPQDLPPSYNDVVAAWSDAHATSAAGEVTTSQNENRYSGGNVTSMQDGNTTSLEGNATSMQDGNTTSLEGNVTSMQDGHTTSLEGDVMSAQNRETTCIDVGISPV